MGDLTAVWFLGVVLVAVWLAFGRVFLAMRARMGPPPDFHDVPWSLLELFLFGLTFLVFSVVGAHLLIRDPSAEGAAEDPWVHVAMFGAQALGTLSVLAVLSFRCRVRRSDLGLGHGRLGTEVLFGLSAYVVFVPIVFLSVPFSNWLLGRFGHEFVPQEVVSVFVDRVRPRGEEGTDWLLVSVFWIAIVAVVPLCEEFLFRSLLLAGLRRYLSTVPAVILSSLLFARFHTLSTFIPVLTLALILGGVYARFRSLPAVVAMHAAHNGLTMVAMSVAGGGL